MVIVKEHESEPLSVIVGTVSECSNDSVELCVAVGDRLAVSSTVVVKLRLGDVVTSSDVVSRNDVLAVRSRSVKLKEADWDIVSISGVCDSVGVSLAAAEAVLLFDTDKDEDCDELADQSVDMEGVDVRDGDTEGEIDVVLLCAC